MEYEIHLYMAVAQALNAPPYRSGDRHPVLVFLRQPPATEHDLDAAGAALEAGGWSDIDFTKAGTLPNDAVADMKEPYASRYLRALAEGSALLVYDPVVQPAPDTEDSTR